MAKKILIVEDDKMLCTIFQMFIQELGYEIAGVARTGEDAMDILFQCKDVDCILMDIQLDGNLDGISTAHLIGQKRTTPVIFVSGTTAPEVVQSAAMKNVYGFITKPIYRQNLGVSIEYACAKCKLEQES
ncbi:MAG: response regulator [Bacteroidales bacterium]|nr:response regulator [Bacteroidales bacterium]